MEVEVHEIFSVNFSVLILVLSFEHHYNSVIIWGNKLVGHCVDKQCCRFRGYHAFFNAEIVEP